MDIVENALRSIRFEMDAVVFRTAMSPGIREQHDQFPMIANPRGQMVVGQFGSFIHGLMKTYTKPVEDGDIILLSDPYSCEGAVSHANDWLAVMPIFVPSETEGDQGKLVGWAAMFGHMSGKTLHTCAFTYWLIHLLTCCPFSDTVHDQILEEVLHVLCLITPIRSMKRVSLFLP